MDWHPGGGQGITVWDVGRQGTEASKALPWPNKVALEQADFRLDDLSFCSKVPDVFVVSACEKCLSNKELLDSLVTPLKHCEQRVLFVHAINPDEQFLESVKNMFDTGIFTYIVLSKEKNESDVFSALRVTVEQLQQPNDNDENYPFSLKVNGAEDRIVELVIEQKSNNEVATPLSFCQFAASMRQWVSQWKTGENNAWQPILKKIKQRVSDLQKVKGEVKADAPSLELPKLAFFYDKKFPEKINENVKAFTLEMDKYLATWFAEINDTHSQRKTSTGTENANDMEELGKALLPRVSICDVDFNKQLTWVEGKQEEIIQYRKGLLGDIRSDFTPVSRRNVDWRGGENRDFQRQYFCDEEQAVTCAIESVLSTSEYMASLKSFVLAAFCAFALAVFPVLIMRWGYLPTDYLTSISFIFDLIWSFSFMIFTVIAMGYFSWRRYKSASSSLQKLESAMTDLLSRQQQAFQKTEAYLANILAKRQYFQLEKMLTSSREVHSQCRSYVEEADSLINHYCPTGSNNNNEDTLELPKNATPLVWWQEIAKSVVKHSKSEGIGQSDERRSGATLEKLKSSSLTTNNNVLIKKVSLP